MNLWHDIPMGESSEEFNVIIEIPKDSHNKYEIDKETGVIKLDRVNYGTSAYPFDYGFVPRTLWDDGDALDVIVLTTHPLQVGIMAVVRPVAVMEMIDAGESDYKIIAVPVKDKRWDNVKDLADVNEHTLKEYKNFFETYKQLKGGSPEKSKVEIKNIMGKKEAVAAVERSIELYRAKFGKK
jgi:inorganic pyrophosphatase